MHRYRVVVAQQPDGPADCHQKGHGYAVHAVEGEVAKCPRQPTGEGNAGKGSRVILGRVAEVISNHGLVGVFLCTKKVLRLISTIMPH
jgi:hypothetical protein